MTEPRSVSLFDDYWDEVLEAVERFGFYTLHDRIKEQLEKQRRADNPGE